MNEDTVRLIFSLFLFALDGCTQGSSQPLLFGQTQTLGISINGSTTQQDVQLTLGYRDFNVAVIPTTVRQSSGDVTQLRAVAIAGNQTSNDALSVLGQFDANSKANSPEVGLGKFFATGLAAKRLADGFAAKLAGGQQEGVAARGIPGTSIQPLGPVR